MYAFLKHPESKGKSVPKSLHYKGWSRLMGQEKCLTKEHCKIQLRLASPHLTSLVLTVPLFFPFLKGKVHRSFSFLILLEISSKLILADSTTNQTKLFHGNSTPSWLTEQHDKEVYNPAFRQRAPHGFGPKMQSEPWEGVLTDKKAVKFYLLHYI